MVCGSRCSVRRCSSPRHAGEPIEKSEAAVSPERFDDCTAAPTHIQPRKLSANFRPTQQSGLIMSSVSEESEPNTSERVARHSLTDRLYHWVMAAATFVLLGTAFLPILGFKFEWVSIHWMTGVLLTLLILVHIVRAVVWQDWRNMMIWPTDVRDIWRGFVSLFSSSAPMPEKPGKYNPLQKLYHLGIAVFVLGVVGTGLLMLLKIDTPFWKRNPYLLSNDTWGWIYAAHGLTAMAMITMIIIHVYFALRPDEFYLTRSMFRGWITKKEHAEHHDANKWQG